MTTVDASKIVFQEWMFELPMQQQSVLLLAARGPDGISKVHLCKPLIQRYRATVLKAAYRGRPLAIDEVRGGGTFMTLMDFSDDKTWGSLCSRFFNSVDEIPHHYYLHLMHGAEIIGYKHPDILFRKRWSGFYEQCCYDMHVGLESMQDMDARLGDWGREFWNDEPVPE